MRNARSFFIVLFLAGSFAGASPATPAEHTSPPSARSHEVSVVRQVAMALAAGSEAIEALRGPPIENSNLDRLNLPTPGMDCGIARSLIYVACHSASLNKNEADAMFARIIDDVQTALPSDSWRPVETGPHAGLIRNGSYQHWKSGANRHRFGGSARMVSTTSVPGQGLRMEALLNSDPQHETAAIVAIQTYVGNELVCALRGGSSKRRK
jgi:hypothetical protein